MTETSERSSQPMSLDSIESISSLESLDGTSPSSSPDGDRDLFGQPVVHVPHSVKRGNVARVRSAKVRCLCGALDELATQYARSAATHGWPTSATYGRKPGGLQPSATLDESLGSKLRAQAVWIGSREYVVRWRFSVTLLGLRISRLRASARRNSDSDYGGWPTPNVPNGGRSIAHAELKGGTAYHKGKKVQVGLEAVAKMAGWPTPNAERPDADTTFARGNPTLGKVAGWATPRVGHGYGSPKRAQDAKGRLEDQAHGMILSGSDVETESSGRLNPGFVRWLMGFPVAWDDCAPTATRSSRKSRQRS